MPDTLPHDDSRVNTPHLPATATDLTGRTLGEFVILRRIGAGGMGQVYLARQLSLKREVALKLLRHDLAGNPIALKRFQAEAEAVATLNHPNIVQVYGAGEDGGLRYIALEFVDGRNLRDHLARKGPPELPVALSIIRQVAAALQKAHERGLVHRDIKPENILVTRKVEVKVTDFGLSRFFSGTEAVHLTQSGVTLGTPLYLSPEQAQGKTVDHRSDLYSLGVTCYHLLSGEVPFRGATAVEVALKHVTDTERPLAAIRPDLPADLCTLVHRLMAKKPEERYSSAREVLRDLMRIRDGISLTHTPMALGITGSITSGQSAAPVLSLPSSSGSVPALESLPSGHPLPPHRKRWQVAGIAGVLAALVGTVAAMASPSRSHRGAEPQQPVAGLLEVRPSEKPTTARERELLAILAFRAAKPDDIVTAGIELGLLYLREGRIDEAEARFEALGKERFEGPLAMGGAHLASKFGRAVVMAHRDNDPKFPQAAHSSVRLFTEAIAGMVPNPFPKLKNDRAEVIRWFLAGHPDLAQAIGEALHRDAANGAKLTVQLEALRTPRGLTRKDK